MPFRSLIFDRSRRRPVDTGYLRPSPGLIAAEHGGRTLLLDIDGGRYFGLDGVGSRIWALIGDGREMSEVAEHLVNEYDAPRETIVRDLRALVAELRGRGLLS